jgi:diguanylate cyclase (GGDEF)-like protein
MNTSFSKFFSAPLFEHKERSDQAALLNRFLLLFMVIFGFVAALLFIWQNPRAGVFLLPMLVFTIGNKLLLQLKRYLAAAWIFVIGLSLLNLLLGGMLPLQPIQAMLLPFIAAAARLLINRKAALVLFIFNALGYALFMQPPWTDGLPAMVVFAGVLLFSALTVLLADWFATAQARHTVELSKLCQQLQSDHHAVLQELNHTKEILLSEHEARRNLETKVGSATLEEVGQRYNPFTGIFNESAVKETLELEISRTRRYQRPLSLLCVKVDDFDSIKEQTALRPEKLLDTLSDTFLEALRREDMLGHSGDDGFFVILPETGRYASYVVGERLRHLVEVLSLANAGEDISLTVSVGISSYQDQGKATPESFMQQTLEAVDSARSHGGNWTVSWHDMSHNTL